MLFHSENGTWLTEHKLLKCRAVCMFYSNFWGHFQLNNPFSLTQKKKNWCHCVSLFQSISQQEVRVVQQWSRCSESTYGIPIPGDFKSWFDKACLRKLWDLFFSELLILKYYASLESLNSKGHTLFETSKRFLSFLHSFFKSAWSFPFQ